MQDQIINSATKWAQAIESRTPENVIKLYHPDGVLWGTLAQEYRHGHKNIVHYFDSFLDKEDLRCEFKDGIIRVHHDLAFYSGAYEFTWTFAGKPVVLPARFSFVYKKVHDDWLIMEHHSSMFPDKPFRIRKFIKKINGPDKTLIPSG